MYYNHKLDLCIVYAYFLMNERGNIRMKIGCIEIICFTQIVQSFTITVCSSTVFTKQTLSPSFSGLHPVLKR